LKEKKLPPATHCSPTELKTISQTRTNFLKPTQTKKYNQQCNLSEVIGIAAIPLQLTGKTLYL